MAVQAAQRLDHHSKIFEGAHCYKFLPIDGGTLFVTVNIDIAICLEYSRVCHIVEHRVARFGDRDVQAMLIAECREDVEGCL